MSPGEESQVLVVLNAPSSLEEPLIDWLLGHDGGLGFTSFPVFGHSSGHDGLSAAEQVSGRIRRRQFQVQMAGAVVDEFLAGLEASMAGADIRYWVLPILGGRTGQLG